MDPDLKATSLSVLLNLELYLHTLEHRRLYGHLDIRCPHIIRERRVRMDEKRKKLIEEIGELAMYNDMTFRG